MPTELDIVFSDDLPFAIIENLRRYHIVDITKTYKVGFILTDREKELRQTISECGIWKMLAKYPLAKEYPDSHIFNCYSADSSINLTKLLLSKDIKKYANLFTIR